MSGSSTTAIHTTIKYRQNTTFTYATHTQICTSNVCWNVSWIHQPMYAYLVIMARAANNEKFLSWSVAWRCCCGWGKAWRAVAWGPKVKPEGQGQRLRWGEIFEERQLESQWFRTVLAPGKGLFWTKSANRLRHGLRVCKRVMRVLYLNAGLTRLRRVTWQVCNGTHWNSSRIG